MAIRVCTGIGAAASFLAGSAMAHMAQMVPMSRQVSYSRANGRNANFEHFENRETAYNSGGTSAVRNRGKAEINAAVQEAHGGSGAFPLIYTPSAANGNMLESNEIAKRHFVCGDPPNGQTIESHGNTYSTANRFWEPLTTYNKGQVIEMKLKVLAYHYGHVEFSICDTADQRNRATANQECFNKYPLTRADGDDFNSPIDPDYPGRYYVAPPCVAYETGQNINEDYVHVERNPGGYQTYTVTVRYKLPEIKCTHCILQMHYFTGHVCGYPGYDEFKPSSWPSDCAPKKNDWIKNKNNLPEGGEICGATTSFHNYPQEFWNCADIKIKDPCAKYGGIHNNTPEGLDTCCAEDCGVCARNGCADRGRNNCCPFKIRSRGKPCSATNPAPCVLDPCAEFGGIYNYHPKGDTCCSESCGVCENADCRQQPGARANCCPGFLRAADNTCSETNPAPCKLATNLVL